MTLRKLLDQSTRRDFLRLAAVGAVGASASGWLDVVAQQAHAQERTTQARAKRCIVLFMSGGPAHTFTFDLKGGERGCPAGFLPPNCRPMILQDVARGIANLQPSAQQGGVAGVRNRFGLLEENDQAFLNEYQDDAIRAHLAGYRSAVQLMDMQAAQ